MKVAAIELVEVVLPLREAFVTGAGARRERRVLLLKVDGEEGVHGWGECVAGEDPGYSYETTDTAWLVLTKHILPRLIGREIVDPLEISHVLAPVRGHPMAKAAAEMALWDLQARELGVPLWELLGGSGEPVPAGVVVGLFRDVDALLRTVERSVSLGYARVKLKVDRASDDVARVRAVRERFPELPLMVDGGASYGPADLPRLRDLDALGLTMIEQPLGHEDLIEHATLQKELVTPICLDESIRSEGDARLAIQIGACRVINVKPGRVGGLASARSIHDLCRERGVPVWCGGMLETGIGRAHNISLATLPGFTLPGDLSESRRYWERDIVDPEIVLERGRVGLPAGTGICVEPDLERISRLAVRGRAFGQPARVVTGGS
jgi:O-succinylbenzoate synthase